jgi:hypothetical protein
MPTITSWRRLLPDQLSRGLGRRGAADARTRRLLFPDAGHVMEYHVLARAPAGPAWPAPVRLRQGDVVILPRGNAHLLSNDPDLQPTRIDPDWVAATRDAPEPIPNVFHSQYEFSWGEHAPPGDTELVCNFLSCDRHPFNPLLDALPHLLHLPASSSAAAHAALGQLALRADRDQPGAAALLERASETMFIDALRRYLECRPAAPAGWPACATTRSDARWR